MITIRPIDFDDAIKYFENLEKDQLPFAQSKAANDLAFLVREAEMKEMQRVFDRPKPQTVRNIRVFKGNKQRPSATVAFQQIYDGDEYMVTEVQGGARKMKRSEKFLGSYYVPGAGADLDRYGNIKGSQLTKILSQLRLLGETGYLGNMTARSKGRKTGAKKTEEYFLVREKSGGLAPGVYRRVQSGVGFGGKTAKALPFGSYQKGKTVGKYSSVIRSRGVIPVLIFVKNAPRYGTLYPFFDVARQVTKTEGPRVIREAVEYATRTARR